MHTYSFLFVILIGQLSLSSISGQNPKCDILHNGIDLQTKLYLTEIAPAVFFNHSPPEIKNELQEENLIQCTGQIVKKEDETELHLNLRINSKIAPEIYGSVEAAFILKVILIDGKEVTLKCFAGSKGVLTPDKTAFIYPLGYRLENKDSKTLSKKEIDKIGIQWSSGYEEYTIYEVDFLMNQLTCLDQATLKRPN